MSGKNRGDRIQLLHKVVSKHFTPVTAPDDRTVLEHLVYACCLEDATYDAADEAFHRLRESFFDWNEVRVTTITEICESLHNLPDAAAAAVRIKKNLQSLFETRYSFDIDDMIKMNQGKAVQELEKLGGMTKFVLAYTTQNALGGHSIAVSSSLMDILLATEVVTQLEADKGTAPGLERTVPKTKGAAFASCLHQFAIAYRATPSSKTVLAILKEAGGAPIKKAADAPEKAPAKPAKKKAAPKATEEPKVEEKATGKKAPAKPAAAKKKAAAKTPAKKAADKPAAAKKAPASKKAASSAGKKMSKKKPR